MMLDVGTLNLYLDKMQKNSKMIGVLWAEKSPKGHFLLFLDVFSAHPMHAVQAVHVALFFGLCLIVFGFIVRK